VYFRYDREKTVMIAYNSNEKPITVATDRFTERTAGFTKALNVITDEQLNAIDNIVVPARTALILELK